MTQKNNRVVRVVEKIVVKNNYKPAVIVSIIGLIVCALMGMSWIHSAGLPKAVIPDEIPLQSFSLDIEGHHYYSFDGRPLKHSKITCDKCK